MKEHTSYQLEQAATDILKEYGFKENGEPYVTNTKQNALEEPRGILLDEYIRIMS